MWNKVFIFLLLSILSVYHLNAQDGIITFEVGSSTVTLLSEGQRTGGTNVLEGATEEMIKQAIPEGAYPSATNVFLIELAGKVMLIDAGLGKKTIENLELFGKKASDVDAIFITHLHGDHIGSLALDNVKSYPKATIYLSKPEYDYYMNDETLNNLPENRRGGILNMRKLFDIYKNQLTVFTPGEIDNANALIPGIKGVAAYGHTPGHAGYLLESDGSSLFFWGDLTHAMAIQMPFPEVALVYDTDKTQAIETRQKLLKYVADNNIRIAGAHIQFPGMGDLKKNTSHGYKFTLTCSCEGQYPDTK